MTFMASLAANPSGSGIYGQPAQQNDQDVLGIVNRLKDREMQDFQNKANFMSDLSLKQDRMKRLFDVNDQLYQNSQPSNPQSGMNVVMGKDPNAMTGYEKGELGIKQQGINVDKQRLTQQGKLGTEALDIKQQQGDLNKQKADQMNQQKTADIQRKIEESNQKFATIQAELERKTKAGEDTLQLHKDIQVSAEERHQLEKEKMKHDMQLKDDQFNELKKQHDELLKQRGRSQTTTEANPEGTQKTVTTEKGSAIGTPIKNSDGTYTVTAPNGAKGIIPADKLDDWMKNYHPGGSQDQEE